MSVADFICKSKQKKNFLINLLWEANNQIMSIYNNYDFGITYKKDDSPLTKADLAANQILIDGLSHFSPELPIVSEENKESLTIPLNNDTFWLIDPLDGTKEFINRNNEFTCNLALIEKNKVTFGFVGIPAMKLVYEGGFGFGSRKHFSNGNYEVIKCTNQKEVIRVVASKSHLNKDTIDFIKNLGKETELIQAGSSLKFIKVAEGFADLYPRMAPTCEWDTAAAHAVVDGAGGSVIDDNGEFLVYGKKNILNPHFIVKGLN
tara:strand:+ start:107 stop:892 length:786 start_codon:yes stop_codon:yes gene_type:complete